MENTHTWTDAQLSAINTRGKTLLVSAAAGSGKTATLTERIIQSLTRENDPAKASRPFDRDRDGLVPGGGAATVILAMGAGKKAATAIDEYLSNK